MNSFFRITILFIFLVLPLIVLADQIKHVECGSEWINIHKNNPDLIGVYINQLPDNIADQAAYRNKHPVLITFIFKNNKAHAVEYSPTGQVQTGEWYDIPSGKHNKAKMITNLKYNTYCAWWKSK